MHDRSVPWADRAEQGVEVRHQPALAHRVEHRPGRAVEPEDDQSFRPWHRCLLAGVGARPGDDPNGWCRGPEAAILPRAGSATPERRGGIVEQTARVVNPDRRALGGPVGRIVVGAGRFSMDSGRDAPGVRLRSRPRSANLLGSRIVLRIDALRRIIERGMRLAELAGRSPLRWIVPSGDPPRVRERGNGCHNSPPRRTVPTALSWKSSAPRSGASSSSWITSSGRPSPTSTGSTASPTPGRGSSSGN